MRVSKINSEELFYLLNIEAKAEFREEFYNDGQRVFTREINSMTSIMFAELNHGSEKFIALLHPEELAELLKRERQRPGHLLCDLAVLNLWEKANQETQGVH